MDVVAPQRRVRFQYQDIVLLDAFAHDQREASVVVVQLAVVRPPGGMIGEDGRIVILARSRQRHVRQVLVHEVYAQDILPVAQPFEVFERFVPSAAAIGFAERA